MSGGRFIILETPALCRKCRRYLAAGRGAFWGSAQATCVPCTQNIQGIVPMTAEEWRLIDDKMKED